MTTIINKFANNKFLTILAYSDIHHHEYTNGLVEEDVVKVEHTVKESCSALDVDIIVFGGDRFQSRNPTDYVKYCADKAFADVAKLGKPMICLVGNHDRSTKNNESHHSLKSIELMDFPNVVIADKISIHDMRIRGRQVKFYCVPAGHVPTLDAFGPDKILREPDVYKICLFHDMLDGCITGGGTLFAGNNELVKFLDYHEFDVVIGGDNHRGQVLKYENSNNVIVYAGAPMEHSRNDSSWNSSGTVCNITLSEVGLATAISMNAVGFFEPLALEQQRVWFVNQIIDNNRIHVARYDTNAPKFQTIECAVSSTQDYMALISKISEEIKKHTCRYVPEYRKEDSIGLFNGTAGFYREQTTATLTNSILSVNIRTDSEEFEGMVPALEKKTKALLGARQVSITIENTGVKVYEPAVAKTDDVDLWAQFVKERAYDNANDLIELGLGYINDKSTKD